MKKKVNKLIIGASDSIDLPELGIKDLLCRVDSGAATSSIHCSRIRLQENDGEEILAVKFLGPKRPQYTGKFQYFSDFDERKVRSSNGEEEYRYVIRTDVVLFEKTFKAELTLTDRGKMKYPVLLGRELLKKGFLVDVNKHKLSYREKLKNNHK